MSLTPMLIFALLLIHTTPAVTATVFFTLVGVSDNCIRDSQAMFESGHYIVQIRVRLY